MKIHSRLQRIKAQKQTRLFDEQKKAIEIGREQFKRLLEKKLTIPVVLL